MNVIDPLLHLARTNPNAPALISPTTVIRFGQLERLTHTVASHFIAAGVGRGDLIPVAIDDSPLHIIVLMALARIGAISTNSLPSDPRMDMGALSQRLGVKAVCHASPNAQTPDGVPALLIDDSWLKLPGGTASLPPVFSGRDTVWRYCFSSGTAGKWKAIPLTHAASVGRAIASAAAWPAGPDDRILPAVGLTTGFGLNACFRHLFRAGAVVFAGGPLHAVLSDGSILDLAERFRVTHIATSPILLAKLMAAAPRGVHGAIPSLRYIAVGGGAIPEALRSRAASFFSGTLLSMYGATEVDLIAVGNPEVLSRYPDAAGLLMPGVDVEAVDENDRPLPLGVEGRLRIQTPYMATGYLNEPELSAEVFKNGWFYLGDIGCLMPDGVVRMVGRADDLINVGGVKLSPARIENELSDLQNVADVAAVALADSDGRARLGVAIVPHGEVDLQAFEARLRKEVPRALPVLIGKIREIPRNAMGKVMRKELATLLAGALAQHAK